jgi:hypothetical protein
LRVEGRGLRVYHSAASTRRRSSSLKSSVKSSIGCFASSFGASFFGFRIESAWCGQVGSEGREGREGAGMGEREEGRRCVEVERRRKAGRRSSVEEREV